jgi:hypothetical protein
MRNPILNGLGLMLISFTAFMCLTAMQFEETKFVVAEAATFEQVQEVKKQTRKTPKICVDKLQTQQKAIADKLRQIKKDLNKMRK